MWHSYNQWLKSLATMRFLVDIGDCVHVEYCLVLVKYAQHNLRMYGTDIILNLTNQATGQHT